MNQQDDWQWSQSDSDAYVDREFECSLEDNQDAYREWIETDGQGDYMDFIETEIRN